MSNHPTSQTSPSTRRPPANPDRERRGRTRNRRASQRRASATVKSALESLPAGQRQQTSGVSRRASTTTRRADKGVLAFASNPISFTVTKTGELKTQDPRGTARHEVAHFTIPAGAKGPITGDQQHDAITASGAQGSDRGLARAPATARLPQSQRIQRRGAERVRQTNKVPLALPTLSTGVRVRKAPKSPLISIPKGATGFSPTHNREARSSTSPTTRQRAGEQARKLGRRLKKRGIDF